VVLRYITIGDEGERYCKFNNMAKLYIGQIEEFNPDTDKWDIYIERINTFFEANEIEDDSKKRAIFLTSFGVRGYTVLRNLCTPKKPAEEAWADIQKKLWTHFSPKTNPIVERRDFYKRDRVDGERVAAYLAQLRALADKCEFGDFLTTALRDRLVTGINDERMMRRLLQEPFKDLTLDRALEICTAMETAVKIQIICKPQHHCLPYSKQ
jgi:hypothetical protein